MFLSTFHIEQIGLAETKKHFFLFIKRFLVKKIQITSILFFKFYV